MTKMQLVGYVLGQAASLAALPWLVSWALAAMVSRPDVSGGYRFVGPILVFLVLMMPVSVWQFGAKVPSELPPGMDEIVSRLAERAGLRHYRYDGLGSFGSWRIVVGRRAASLHNLRYADLDERQREFEVARSLAAVLHPRIERTFRVLGELWRWLLTTVGVAISEVCPAWTFVVLSATVALFLALGCAEMICHELWLDREAARITGDDVAAERYVRSAPYIRGRFARLSALRRTHRG